MVEVAAVEQPLILVDPAARVGWTAPLAVIRLEDADADYASALDAALGEALAARPWARFALVAVAPDRAPAEEAAAILQGLADLGVAPERVGLRVARLPGTAGGEARLYLR